MKLIRKKSLKDEFMDFLRKDPVNNADFFYSPPFDDEDLDEILRIYGGRGSDTVILLKSGRKIKSKISKIKYENKTMELNTGEEIPFSDIEMLSAKE